MLYYLHIQAVLDSIRHYDPKINIHTLKVMPYQYFVLTDFPWNTTFFVDTSYNLMSLLTPPIPNMLCLYGFRTAFSIVFSRSSFVK